MISPDAVVSTFPQGVLSSVLKAAEVVESVRSDVPDFANTLLLAVDEAWNNLSTLAKCSSHRDLCVIAGARIAKELHKKGATTGTDAFESFKSVYERFTPSPNILQEVPLPSIENKPILSGSKGVPPTHGSTSITGNHQNSFSSQFETVLKKVHWSPAERTTTSRTAGIQPSSRSSDGKNTIGSQRTIHHPQKRSAEPDFYRDPKRPRSLHTN